MAKNAPDISSNINNLSLNDQNKINAANSNVPHTTIQHLQSTLPQLTEAQQHKIAKARISIDSFYINLQKDAKDRHNRYVKGFLGKVYYVEKTTQNGPPLHIL